MSVSNIINCLHLYLWICAPSKFLFRAAVCVYLAEPGTGVPSCECACVCTHCAWLAESHCGRSQNSSCLPQSSLGMCLAAGWGRAPDPLLSLQVSISRPVTAGTGVTADQQCLPPTSASPSCGLSGSQCDSVTGHSVPVGLFCHGQHVLAGVSLHVWICMTLSL